MFDVKLTITGLQQAQAKNLRAIAALRPGGALSQAIQYGSLEAHRAAVTITHVDTGALRASHRVTVSNTRGVISIDPGATNPRSGQRVADYAAWEHRRGGSHGFYKRVEQEQGQRIGRQMGQIVRVQMYGS